MEKIIENRHMYMKYIRKKEKWCQLNNIKKPGKGVVKLNIPHVFAYIFVG